MKPDRNAYFIAAKRIVVKVGSNVLTETDGLNLAVLSSISDQLCRLLEMGKEVILVSSGAMAVGFKKVGLSKRPEEIPKRQAVAAVGQAGLMLEYEKAFSANGIKVAQILLTSEDLTSRKRYLNARNTLCTLLDWGIVPIINENDTIMVEEIKVGDNDNLSAMITILMDADLLVNLTDIDGLYTADPRSDPQARFIDCVDRIDRQTQKMASGIPGALGTGGMSSKIKAAQKVTAAGIPMVIAPGKEALVLDKLFGGSSVGTFFLPADRKLASRKCWIAFSVKPRGVLTVDDGAAAAVLKNGKSLLPSGIIAVEGDFQVGAPVQFVNTDRQVLGTGLVNYNANDIRKIMGLQSAQIKARLGQKPYDEVIHRDNLAVTRSCDI